LPIKYDGKASAKRFATSIALQSSKPIKYPKKQSTIQYSIATEKKYKRYLTSIMKRFENIVKDEIFPNLNRWKQDQKFLIDSTDYTTDSSTIKYDAWEDELDDVNKQYIDAQTRLKEQDQESILEELFLIGSAVYGFTSKQWDKVVQSVFGVTVPTVDAWESLFVNQWVKNNVNLITGLSEEYRKAIYNSVSNGITTKQTVASLKEDLKKINKKFTDTRVNLIARDQVSKLHGQVVEQKQLDVGVSWYTWITAFDERVRSRHKPLHDKLCKWNNVTIYSTDGGKTWQSRSSIGAVSLHPGQDYQCRCYAEAYWNEVIEDVNKQIIA